jgi:Ras GTPase-activating-like protein IQGAP2/3
VKTPSKLDRTNTNKISIVITVPKAEVQFDIDEFNDLYARTKPTLYIKMVDIFSIHHLVAAESSYLCPNQDDMLREIIRELGSAKSNEHELMSVSTSEICLTLNPKLHDREGESLDEISLTQSCPS